MRDTKCPECHLWGTHKLDCVTGSRDENDWLDERRLWQRETWAAQARLVQWEVRATRGEAVILIGLAATRDRAGALAVARKRLPPGRWRIELDRVTPRESRVRP